MQTAIEPLTDLPGYPELMSPRQLEEATGIPVSTQASKRFEGDWIPFVKMGHVVRYRKKDVLDYINQRTFSTTREAKGRLLA